MKEIQKALKLAPVVYIARDLERAVGLPLSTKGYWIITNSSPLAKELVKKHKNIIVIRDFEIFDTHELLVHPKSLALFKKLSAQGGPASGRKNPQIVVFKNTKQIEKVCSERGWTLLNPSAELANRVEQKLTQLEWLGPLKKYLPPHRVMRCSELTLGALTPPYPPLKKGGNDSSPLFKGETREEVTTSFIIQFNHAHTGNGTILIESQKQIDELKQKFPNREVRVTQFVSGPVFTSNNVVWTKKVFTENISYQITGFAPFTDRPFATIGNDWALPQRVLSTKQSRQIKQIATDVGKRLARDGWKGLFGIDVIMDEKTGKIYLLEINARQPASTTFESQLQQSTVILSRAKNPSHDWPNDGERDPSAAPQDDSKKTTTFEAHLAALLNLQSTAFNLQPISDGAQIIQRVTNDPLSSRQRTGTARRGTQGEVRSLVKKLRHSALTVIEYSNTNPGDDLLRIQSAQGIMKNASEFNDIGNTIIETLKN